jgi:hypothetical protein
MRRLDPNLALAAAAAFTVAIEAVTRSQARYGPECVLTAAALAHAWRQRERLSASAVVALGAALPALVAAVHLAKHVSGDIDVQHVYPSQGRSLLDGTYPHSEYPPGAVLLFAFEQLVRTARSVNPFAMAVCQGATVWSLSRLRGGAWFAALVALWPTNAFFWEFKYDALPTALLVLGVVAALDERWAAAGVAFGLGAAAKWTPGIAAVVLAGWLLGRRQTREAARLAFAAFAAFAVVVVPFLVWSPGAVWASVSKQAPRGLTPESVWYLPLRAVGAAHAPGAVYEPAAVAHAADTAAVVVQVAVTALLVAIAARRSTTLAGAAVLASAAPATFLLLNKVFSAQYLVTVAAALCTAAVLLRRPALAVLVAVAATANVLVYPIGRFWLGASLVLFATALAAAALAVQGAFTLARYPHGS